ncbi:MAG: ribonuclease P protein subunit [Nanoarchaeota archaeon]
MTSKEVIRHELIGSEVKVIDSSNKSLIGLKGRITDETRSMLALTISNGLEKKLIKNQSTFLIKIKNRMYRISGRLLVGRPEDRLKKKVKT